ncbi:MAG TPA: response regulator, partial [Deltaproteobacteria bacterium]|nr:response regulator [Deltaproteobacteria bacterium]
RREQGRVSCVILDLTMPPRGAAETLDAIRDMDPSAKVVISSGYDRDEAQKRLAGRAISGFIQKPYRYENLFGEISRVAGSASAEHGSAEE